MNKIVVDKDALNNILESPEQRKIAYKIYTALGILLGLAQSFFVIYGYEAIWFNATIGAYLFLAIPFGGLALTNTPASEAQTEIDEADIISIDRPEITE